jgi:signal transduction histidine kinase
MMTHDLRTPVTGLQMIFKMFQKNQFSDPGMKEKYIMEGINQTNKILLNLDNILYMAKSEQREFCINREDIDIKDFMEKTLKSYRDRDYNPKTVKIETIYEPESFHCMMDANLMENVVSNIMENAIKFTGEKAIISVTCSMEKDVVELRFRDNGKGMSESDQKRIFEIFERGSANNDKQFPGFGIGLHFVQRVVNAHGGKITVNSEVSQGTEFIIRFFS